jgi:hypothetical protein
MNTALAKAKRQLRARDIRVTVMRVVLPETGELIGALVPDHPIDRRSMKERKFHVGKQLRATLRQDATQASGARRTSLAAGSPTTSRRSVVSTCTLR